MSRAAGASEQRRAPRLTAEQRLGPYITRRGRFLDRDPLEGRPLPGIAKVLGAVGWAGLLGYAFARAVRARVGGSEPGQAE